jgi:hypothetical protein
MMIPEPSPSDTMPLAKVPAEDVSLEDILLDGGKHRRPDEDEDAPPETAERRRIPVVPAAAAVVALGLVGALVYGTDHQVQGSGTADPASLPAPSVTLPPTSASSSSPVSVPPASAEVRAESSVTTTTAPPPVRKPRPTGAGTAPVAGKPTDTQSIEDSIASSIMSSIRSRFSQPPNHR